MKNSSTQLVFVIPKFQSKKHHEPQQQWHLFLNQLKKNPHYSISILSPLQAIKLKTKPDHIYIVANYLSALIYILLLPPSIPKTLYLAKAKLSFTHLITTLQSVSLLYLTPFYLLSTLNLKPIYQLLATTHRLTRLVFPDPQTSNQFQSLPHLPKHLLPPPLKPIKTKPKTKPIFFKKPQEIWLTYSGSAQLGRGLILLINTFKSLHQANPKLKLILLLLDGQHRHIIEKHLKTLPQNSYHYHLGRLKPAQYFSTLKQTNIYITPFSFYYSFTARPATLIEAMHLNLPIITSDLVTDPIFKHQHNCLKFKAQNQSSLTQQLQTLLSKPQLQKQISTQAKQTLINHTNLSTIYQNHFLPLLSSHITDHFDLSAKTYGSWFTRSLGAKHVNTLEKHALLNLIPNSLLTLAEYGIGRGRLARHLIKHRPIKTYYGLDISPKMLKYLKRLHLSPLKPLLLPQLPPKPVDLILSFRQIKYNHPYLPQLKQMTKLLKPNGQLIIELPGSFSVAFFGQLLSSKKHLTNLINPLKLSRQLKKLKFSNIKLIPLRFLPDNLYLATNSKPKLNLLIKIEAVLAKLLPPIFAKSLIIKAQKTA